MPLGILNKSQIDYIFFHLNHHIEINKDLMSHFRYSYQEGYMGKIIFQLSERNLSDIKIISGLPVLFPLSEDVTFFKFDHNSNLIFNHDLLKSAFYLLSGYQEFNANENQQHERFLFEQSIQKKLDIAEFPLVNAYFEIIIDGLKIFCHNRKVKLKLKNPWNNKKFGFLLTHDIDRIDKYTIHEFKLRLKQLVLGESNNFGIKKKIKYCFDALFKMFTSDNPYWNFDWMKNLEKQYSFISTWFFLPQGQSHKDAYYSFEEQRIKELVKFLQQEGDEIALHGTLKSAQSADVMKDNLSQFKSAFGFNPIGNRYHWLNLRYPISFSIMESLEFKYDASWGFADHIGWRNSYCWPFKPYDIDQDRMIDIWEFPLCVMDVSLFQYQQLTCAEAINNIDKCIQYVKQYQGLFVLLWHNSFLDESSFPGIIEFYKLMLSRIYAEEVSTYTGSSLLEIFEKN